MRVAVVGAGAVGGFYGGLLARAGNPVVFLARGAQLAAIREHGLEVRSVQLGTVRVQAPASDDPAALGPADLVLMAVKTYDVEAAGRAAAALLRPGSMLLTVQNGVEAPDQLAQIVGREPVLVGTASLEATVSGPGVVEHLSPWHRLTVSELDGPPTARVEQLVAVLQEAGINALARPEGRRALWEKALFLVPLAALTAVCGTGIGPIRALPETRALLDAVLGEVAAVARAGGYDLPDGVAAARATVDSAEPGMKASLARDFERRRRTELEALIGAVVRLGEARGVATPATRAIYAILKLREASTAAGGSGGSADAPPNLGDGTPTLAGRVD